MKSKNVKESAVYIGVQILPIGLISPPVLVSIYVLKVEILSSCEPRQRGG